MIGDYWSEIGDRLLVIGDYWTEIGDRLLVIGDRLLVYSYLTPLGLVEKLVQLHTFTLAN